MKKGKHTVTITAAKDDMPIQANIVRLKPTAKDWCTKPIVGFFTSKKH